MLLKKIHSLTDNNPQQHSPVLIASLNRSGIEAYGYLSALLVALPRAKTVDDYEALLPWRIAMANL